MTGKEFIVPHAARTLSRIYTHDQLYGGTLWWFTAPSTWSGGMHNDVQQFAHVWGGSATYVPQQF